MKKPHKHAEVIKAWADGAEVEIQHEDDGTWGLVTNPAFQSRGQYRVYDPLREYKEAFLRGETVEVYCRSVDKWEPLIYTTIVDVNMKWAFIAEQGIPVRITPKPDYKVTGMAYASPPTYLSIGMPVTVTFDGETNQPKAVELVK